jgi:hypothetical protein
MSKQIKKAVAATVAAGTVSAELKLANQKADNLATEYTTKTEGMVGRFQLEIGYKARDVAAMADGVDFKKLIAAYPKQRRSELQAVIGATESDLTQAVAAVTCKGKPGLQQAARALKLVQFGGPVDLAGKAAQAFISQGKKPDWLEATGQKADVPAPKPVNDDAPVTDDSEPEPEQDSGRDVQLPKEQNGWSMVSNGLAILKTEYAGKSKADKAVQASIAEIEGMMETLLAQTEKANA